MLRRLKGLALSLVIGLVGTVASLMPFGAEFEESLGLYWLFHLRGEIKPPADVVVVAIDQQSAQKLGLPNKPSEWPRNLHALLVRNLAAAGAQVITFDLTFEKPGRLPEYDEEFSAAIAEAGNVLIVEYLKREVGSPANGPEQTAADVSTETLVPPIPILQQAALALAPFPLPKASRVNAYWTFMNSAGDLPTLPVVAFQIYALQAKDELLSLWQKTGGPQSVIPSANSETSTESADIQSMVLGIRNAIVNEPQLAERMLTHLRNTTDQELAPKKKRILKSLLSMYLGSDVQYLNFYGPPRSVRTVPYYQVLQSATNDGNASALNAGAFDGKAVFVGFSVSSQPQQDPIRDHYETVFSGPGGLDINGVEIAATAFANLLEDRPLRPLPPATNIGVLWLFGIALGILCWYLRPLPALALTVFFAGAYLFVALHQFNEAAVWFPLVIPLCVQAPLAYVGALGFKYRSARREREAIKSAFGYFLPAGVVDRLAKSIGPITDDNQLVFGTFLATDVEQYTALAEKMAPEPLARVMNDYYGVLFPPVENRGGIISDVVGDAMLALWASASPDATQRQEACLAALEIATVPAPFAESANAPLRTRIGLHSGDVMLGSIGAAHHYEYRAVGDIVNTATRIQGLNKYLGTGTLATDAALEGVNGLLTRPLGSFLLAGKTTPLKVFELIAPAERAGKRQLALCRRFAAALAAFNAQNWCEAVESFSHLLNEFPDDGPTRFYLALSKQHLAAPPREPWEPTIAVDGK